MMTSEEQTETIERRPRPYTETIEDKIPVKSPPIEYIPSKPLDVFETYRDEIMRQSRKVWSKVKEEYTLQPFQSKFRYYDYGGQYSFICALPNDQPTYITITEPFEKEDGSLANDHNERRRRAIVSLS